MATLDNKRFQQLSLAIGKAINSQEMPVKEKHVRSAIIGSFQEQGAVTYWVSAIRLPLQENRIVAWKFCHVTHKLLREGHPACLDDSQRHISTIENLGKLWVHLREGYGRLIHLYAALLAGKLRFHGRNPQFPGAMAVTAAELDSIAENDVNNYFQLCVELFDYMDDILNLQAAVFDSLGNARANSMTASGQCRLAALIPCAQDSSHIYDCNVRLLFRLHAALPPDVLAGHRERFRQQFKKISSFYKHASTMQYFRNLLTLPQLPTNPPNFLLQSDFGTYVAPVVMVPEPEPEHDVGSLVDTSDTMSQMTNQDSVDFADSFRTPSPQPDVILQRDQLISDLQHTLDRQRSELEERGGMLVSLRDHCTALETRLLTSEKELDQERQRAELLSAQTPEITQKLNEVEEKAKLTDEKFQKLKAAYTQLRAEHISLIRQKAEVDKLSMSLKAAVAEHESVKAGLQQQLDDRAKDVELFQQSASNSDTINNELETLRKENVILKANLEKSKEKEAELEQLKISIEETQQLLETKTIEAIEQISEVEDQKKKLSEVIEKIQQEKVQLESEIERLKEEVVAVKDSHSQVYNEVVQEKEAALKKVEELTQLFEQEKKSLEGKLEYSERERLTAECELQDLLQHNTSLEENLTVAKSQLETAQKEVNTYKESLFRTVAEAGVEIVARAMSDAPPDSEVTARAALEQLAVHTATGKEQETARDAVRAAHGVVMLATHTGHVMASVADNELVDSIANETRAMLSQAKQCMEGLARGEHDVCRTCASEAQTRVRTLAARVAAAAVVRGAARSVDDELADMDSSIEEAANRIEELLAASRAADSGVKLEVNSKILDACTTLMAAVRALVRDARKLQNELGDPTTRQRMYRRNPQWSEGLISAAKAVVVAAKLLVTSADEAVSGAGATEGVSAASHEVAGATAQLVAASRARAPPASPALAALTLASRHVAAATGAVVAAVRAAAALTRDHDDLETSALSLTATRRLEMESKVRSLELESALDAERARLAALRRRHYQLAQLEENGNMTNGSH